MKDCGHKIEVNAGSYLVKADIPVEHFYIMLSGSAKLVYEGENAEATIIDLYHSGDFFGEMEMIGVCTNNRNIISLTKCSLICFTRDEFFKLWNENPCFSQKILYVLAARLNRAGDDVVMAEKTVLRERVFKIIQKHIQRGGYFKYTKQVLAEMAGISLRSLNRILKELCGKNLIVVEKGTIRLNE